MDRQKPVSHIMTRDVEGVQIDKKVSDVRRLLADRPFHHVPVLRGRKLVGLLSMADLAPLTLGAYLDSPETIDAHLDARFTLAGIMTAEPETVEPGDSVIRAAELLASGRFHAVPVVDREGVLHGIVTTTDIVRYFLTL